MDTKPTIEQLKVLVYDLLVQQEQISKRLQAVNQEIALMLKAPKSVEVKKEETPKVEAKETPKEKQ